MRSLDRNNLTKKVVSLVSCHPAATMQRDHLNKQSGSDIQTPDLVWVQSLGSVEEATLKELDIHRGLARDDCTPGLNTTKQSWQILTMHTRTACTDLKKVLPCVSQG